MDIELLKTKRWWLEIYKSNNFTGMKTCEDTGIDITIIYKWMTSDQKELYFNDNHLCTFTEAKELIREGYNDKN